MVGEGWATLQELETHWDLDDLMRANAVLDAREHIEKKLTPKPTKGK